VRFQAVLKLSSKYGISVALMKAMSMILCPRYKKYVFLLRIIPVELNYGVLSVC